MLFLDTSSYWDLNRKINWPVKTHSFWVASNFARMTKISFRRTISTKTFQVLHKKTVSRIMRQSRIMRHSNGSVSCLNTDELSLAASASYKFGKPSLCWSWGCGFCDRWFSSFSTRQIRRSTCWHLSCIPRVLSCAHLRLWFLLNLLPWSNNKWDHLLIELGVIEA